jgi:mycobactin lysine-N-oxygenase
MSETSFFSEAQLTPALFSDQPDSRHTLLVLGAGPKGIAIAAKNAIMRELGYDVPRVIVVDRQGVASHWTGDFGFTDGKQPLGTRPEKDIGYPYASTCWETDHLNTEINKKMLLLSWHSYLIENGGRYADWIDRGRLSPTHGEWARYIQWVAQHIDLELCTAEVVAISCSEDDTGQRRWQLSCTEQESGEKLLLLGDGLVITGPGEALTIPGQPEHHPRVLDGASFWLYNEDFIRLRSTLTKPLTIGIIGIGETAAAIALALIDALQERVFIEVISPYGVLYSRDEGFNENRLFSDPDGRLASLYGIHRHELNWLLLSEQDRREFVRRTDRGVFSQHAMEEINRAENVRAVIGTAQRISAHEQKVVVDLDYGGVPQSDEYDYVIVARGFDALWFTELLDNTTRERFAQATGNMERHTIEMAIQNDLSLNDFTPRLHLPMLAGVAQGPGFPNLSCLGLLSDRILRPYKHTFAQRRA